MMKKGAKKGKSSVEEQKTVAMVPMNKDALASVLLHEHSFVYEQMFAEIRKLEYGLVKVIVAIGTILFFCFNNFEESKYGISTLVDVIFLGVIPVLCLASLSLVYSHANEVWSMGNYLKITENKMNRLFRDESKELGFDNGSLMDWEYWVRKYGYLKEGKLFPNISFGLISVLFILFMYLGSVIMRLVYFYNYKPNCFIIGLMGSVAVFLLISVCFIVGACKILKLRKEQNNCFLNGINETGNYSYKYSDFKSNLK